VLLARVRAVFRNLGLHREAEEHEDGGDELRIHNLVIHPGRHQVLVDGQGVELSATEFRLLYALARRPGGLANDIQALEERAAIFFVA